MGVKTLLLLLVALEVRLAAGGHNGRSMPGSPTNISRDDRSLQQVVLATAYSFNNQSNDAFLFKPSTVHRAQQQLVKGIHYIIDLDVSRTVCRKRDHNDHDLSKCDFQPEGRLQQTFRCHSDIWSVPWKHEMKILDCVCKSMKPAEDPGSEPST